MKKFCFTEHYPCNVTHKPKFFYVFPVFFDGEKTFSTDEPLETFTDFETAKESAKKIAGENLEERWQVVNGAVTCNKESCYSGVIYFAQYTEENYSRELSIKRLDYEINEMKLKGIGAGLY